MGTLEGIILYLLLFILFINDLRAYNRVTTLERHLKQLTETYIADRRLR
jgi:hypothetical protein